MTEFNAEDIELYVDDEKVGSIEGLDISLDDGMMDEGDSTQNVSTRWIPSVDDRVVVVDTVRDLQGMSVLNPGRKGIVTDARPDAGEANVQFEARGRDGRFTVTIPLSKLAPRLAWTKLHEDEGSDGGELPHWSELSDIEQAAWQACHIGLLKGPVEETIPEGFCLVDKEKIEALAELLPEEVRI